MTDWQELLNYIDNYVYVTDKEEISIIYNEKAAEADRVYRHFLKKVEERKWEFDIALFAITIFLFLLFDRWMRKAGR